MLFFLCFVVFSLCNQCPDRVLPSGAAAGWELGSRVVLEANRTVERTYRLGCKSGGFAHNE